MIEFETNVSRKKHSGESITNCKHFYFVMKYVIFLLAIFLPVIAKCQAPSGNIQAPTKILIWSDEFDYNGLPNPQNWNMEVGKARANNEPQYYTGELRNAQVADGMLTITVRQEEIEGEKRYTSARINTRGKHEFTNGRIEARAKLPQGRGVWPAFWTLGLTGRWPVCGEIDIMEYWGHNANTIGANVHTGDYNHTKGTGRGGEIVVDDPWKDFHIYAVEWYKDRMDFYFDDKMYFSCKSKGEGIGEWPFDAPQYIILNLALWNNWRGAPGIDDSIFPQEFIVDYVRVYELK
jgi:beta-glucanase (GH16 family)